MAGLGAVLMLYLVLISLGLASWAKLVQGFDPNEPEQIIRIACEVTDEPFSLHRIFFFFQSAAEREHVCMDPTSHGS